MLSTTQKQWLALWLIPKLGPVKILKLVSQFGSINAVLTASRQQLEPLPFITAETKNAILEALSSPLLAKEEELIEKEQVTLICFDDDNYPALLKNIASPPVVLYQKGNSINLAEYLTLAFIGARKASYIAKTTCRETIIKLARIHSKTVIVSGLAYGIDSIAHQAALEAKLPTIAVLGNGLCFVYPEQHTNLARQIIEQGGAVISEFPMLQSPIPSNFPLRNRIISGISQGVVVVEAGEKSGSRITSNFALEQGKEVFAFPGAPNSHFTRGSNRLIQKGNAKLVLDPEDILEEYTFLQTQMQTPATATAATKETLLPIEKDILSMLEATPTQIDTIVANLNKPYQEIMQALTVLELKGYIQALAGQNYTLTHL